MISIALSELKQSGWLEMKLDPDDARKRVYKLKNPEQVVKEIEKKIWSKLKTIEDKNESIKRNY